MSDQTSNMDISSSSKFSKGNGHVVFRDTVVIKTTPDIGEPVFMAMFGSAFAEILSTKMNEAGDIVTFMMPRYIVPDMERDGESLIVDGIHCLARQLWGHVPVNDVYVEDWRDLLVKHLQRRIKQYHLELNPDKVMKLVGDLPKDKEPRNTIHGDATLANMVYDPARGWIWVDPLLKVYIPWDLRVDLGKALQTCWGYERMLVGLQDRPILNERLAMDIARRSGISLEEIIPWCLVHLIRLLPYQDEPTRWVFTRILREQFNLG